MKIYISFGQVHVHSINGKTFDKDCIAVINCENEQEGRDIAFEFFGNKFGAQYSEPQIDKILTDYFPRGLIEINK